MLELAAMSLPDAERQRARKQVGGLKRYQFCCPTAEHVRGLTKCWDCTKVALFILLNNEEIEGVSRHEGEEHHE